MYVCGERADENWEDDLTLSPRPPGPVLELLAVVAPYKWGAPWVRNDNTRPCSTCGRGAATRDGR